MIEVLFIVGRVALPLLILSFVVVKAAVAHYDLLTRWAMNGVSFGCIGAIVSVTGCIPGWAMWILCGMLVAGGAVLLRRQVPDWVGQMHWPRSNPRD